MKKAADDMKAEQERKAQERRRILEERIGNDQHNGVDSEASLKEICKKYHDRIRELEDSRYDLEVKVRAKDYEVRLFLRQTCGVVKICPPVAQRINHPSERFTRKIRQANA